MYVCLWDKTVAHLYLSTVSHTTSMNIFGANLASYNQMHLLFLDEAVPFSSAYHKGTSDTALINPI